MKSKFESTKAVKADISETLLDVNLKLQKAQAGGLLDSSSVIQPPLEFSNYGLSPFYGDEASSSARYGLYGLLFGNGYENRGLKSENYSHAIIAACNRAYESVGVVRTIVNLLADFACEEIIISHPNESVQNFYRAWASKVDLKNRLIRFATDLFSAGQVFIWREEAQLSEVEEKSLKRSKATIKLDNNSLMSIDEDGEQTLITAQEQTELTAMPATQDRIPWGYKSLNPLQMSKRGAKFIGKDYWVMLLDKSSADSIKKKFGSHGLKNSEINIPPETAKDQDVKQQTYEYTLDKDRLYVIQDQSKKDYEIWATPLIYPALEPIQRKRLYTAGEMSALEGIKRSITLIKVGKTQEGFAPTDAKLQRVADALAGGGQCHYLVWDDLIEGQILQPQLQDILDPKKYDAVNEDIFISLGVSKSILQGTGSYANSFITIKLLLEKLETVRDQLTSWLMGELKAVAKILGFRTLPVIQFGRMNLRDENAERALVVQLYDRGILSRETLLSYFDENVEVEANRQKQEKTFVEKDVMESKGPFIKQPNESKNIPGRPRNDKSPQEKKRNTKPKGIGGLLKYNQMRQYIQGIHSAVVTKLTEDIVAAYNVKDYRSLAKDVKNHLENDIYKTLAQIQPNTDISTLVYTNLVYNSKTEDILSSFKELSKNSQVKEQREDLFHTIYSLVWSEEE